MANIGVGRKRRGVSPSRALTGDSLWKRFSSAHQLAYGYAEQQAAQEGLSEIAPEQLLRGMLRIGPSESNGVRLIEEMGVTPEQVDARLSQGHDAVVWPPQPVKADVNNLAVSLSPASETVARESRISADAMGHDRIGTEHLLIALLASGDAAITNALVPCGITQTACRERLGAWLVNGTYRREQVSAIVQTAAVPSSENLIRTIFAIRRWSSLIYVIWVLGTWIASLVVPMPYSTWLNILYGVTVYPLLFFIVPYILSTYALNSLLNSRFTKGLNAMPPGRSMIGLGLQFALCGLLGVGMIAGLIPDVIALLGGHIASISFGTLPVIIVALQWAFLLNCLVLIATHWLLTLNVR